MSLYPPPQTVQAEVWTRLPDEYNEPSRRSAWLDANKPGMKMGSFLEGPTVDRDGALFVCDIPFGRIFRITPAGEWSLVTEYDGWPNGLALHRDGRLFIADYRRGILTCDPATGRIAEALTSIQSESFKGVNDLIFDQSGRLYFTLRVDLLAMGRAVAAYCLPVAGPHHHQLGIWRRRQPPHVHHRKRRRDNPALRIGYARRPSLRFVLTAMLTAPPVYNRAAANHVLSWSPTSPFPTFFPPTQLEDFFR